MTKETNELITQACKQADAIIAKAQSQALTKPESPNIPLNVCLALSGVMSAISKAIYEHHAKVTELEKRIAELEASAKS